MKEYELVEKLIEKNLKISTAESCTGGLLASTLINVPSASKILDMSFVTYSNEAKEKICGVKKATIEKYNVVSTQVAEEMAIGVANFSNSDIGVGITGIAGPSGGTAEIPLGTVCFGFYINGEVYTFSKLFSGERNEIRGNAVDFAINELLRLL